MVRLSFPSQTSDGLDRIAAFETMPQSPFGLPKDPLRTPSPDIANRMTRKGRIAVTPRSRKEPTRLDKDCFEVERSTVSALGQPMVEGASLTGTQPVAFFLFWDGPGGDSG